ncbi:MAG: tetratricopeptide repeat protein [Candidatus Omnitrophica bacterium]|nr:tetratricopeptide repeat protein [Candidatus Omnitrophota bacterium]
MLIPCAAATVFSSEEAAYKYARSAVEKARIGNFKEAIDDLKAARLYDPSNRIITKNLAIIYNNYGMELMKKGDISQAIEKFESALSYDRDDPITLYNLGVGYYKIQNMARAKRFLERAHALKPEMQGVAELLEKAGRETAIEKDFEKTDTQHFIIASSDDIPVEKLSYIRTWLEEAYGRVGAFLDHYPKNKIIVILYSEANYDAMLRGRPHWTLAVFDGKVRIPVNKFKYTNEDVIRILYHEYAHAVTFGIAGNKCPLWVSEGIAGKAEDLAGMRNAGIVRDNINAAAVYHIREMPRDFARIKDVRLATSLYAQSYLLIDFIVNRVGPSGLRSMLARLRDGQSAEHAIEALFDRDIEQFERDLEGYIKERYGITGIVYS